MAVAFSGGLMGWMEHPPVHLERGWAWEGSVVHSEGEPWTEMSPPEAIQTALVHAPGLRVRTVDRGKLRVRTNPGVTGPKR